MSYDDIKKLAGRRPVNVVEMALDRCIHTYGQSPCTASLDPQFNCFNTLQTCQDKSNYNRGGSQDRLFIRLSDQQIQGLQGSNDPPTFPVLKSVEVTPTKLEPGKGLGIRSSVSIQCMDFPWTDVVTDPYRSSRVGAPAVERGSFFGKLIARNPNYQGRVVRIYSGFLSENGFDIDDFTERLYVLDRISGPDSNGRVTIQAKDPLKFADRERSQWPTPTDAELSADVSDSATSISVIDSQGDIQSAFAAGQYYIRIGEEVMRVTNVAGSGPSYTLTVSRATIPSFYTGQIEPEEHAEGDTVQVCWEFDDIRIDDLVYFLLNTAAGVEAGFLPLSNWNSIISQGLTNYRFSCLLTEPEGVNDLLEEITQHTILIWWDEREQVVKMDSIIQRQITSGPYSDQENIVQQSIAVTRAERDRISQVWMQYGLVTPIADMDKISSYARVKVFADLDAESPENYGDRRVRRVKSRWLPSQLQTVAEEIGQRLLINYRDPKTIVSCQMDPKDDNQWTGDRILLQTSFVQNAFGDHPLNGYRILQVAERGGPGEVKYEYVLAQEPLGLRTGVITPDENPENPDDPFPDYSNASPALISRYAFIGYDDGSGPPPNPLPFPDGSPPYTIS